MPGDVIFTLLVVALILAAIYYYVGIRRITIFEHERAVVYRNGKFKGILEPGRHWYSQFSQSNVKVDMRLQAVTIPGQEVLSSDNISLRISLAASYKIGEPYRVLSETENYQTALYLALQLLLRDLIGSLTIDELLAKRTEISEILLAETKPKAEEIGISLVSVGIKDIMFPGELKGIFAKVVNARNDGLAALERARGESAALRNLANTAKLLENNPALLQLRILQTMSEGSGNTVVLKVGDVSDVQLPATKEK